MNVVSEFERVSIVIVKKIQLYWAGLPMDASQAQKFHQNQTNRLTKDFSGLKSSRVEKGL